VKVTLKGNDSAVCIKKQKTNKPHSKRNKAVKILHTRCWMTVALEDRHKG